MMETIFGKYFDGQTSTHIEVFLKYNKSVVQITDRNNNLLHEYLWDDVRVDPPLGKIKRVIKFKTDEKFETDDFDKVKVFEELTGDNKFINIVDLFERRWKLVFICLIGMLGFVFWFTVYGIPFTAKVAAHSLPIEIMDNLSKETMDILDKRLFKPSMLKKEEIKHYKDQFTDLLKSNNTRKYKYEIHFRSCPRIGPNAFALPSGTIVVTDQLVKILNNDMELTGILMHEIGHVEKRHGLRSIIQNAGVFLIVSVIVGDVASITSLTASLPTLFINTGYSRQFEREADLYSAVYFQKNNLDNKPMRDILQRLTQKHPKSSKAASFISTHPLTEERLRFYENYGGVAKNK